MVHEKEGAAVAGASVTGRKYTVEMRVRVTVAASSCEEAIENAVNTGNWQEWQWVGQRMAGEKTE